MNYKDIDRKAVQLSRHFKKAEADLLNIIIDVDQGKVYRKFGYNSLYQYVHQRLQLSESQTYAFMSVARKSYEAPKLKEAIQTGRLTVSKAKRITAVIDQGNQDHWIEMAAQKNQKSIEREVALAQPAKAIRERASYIPLGQVVPDKIQIKQQGVQIKLEVGLSEKVVLKLRRAQDLISQKKRKSVILQTTIEVLVDEFIKKHDPVEKAKRQKLRGKLTNEDITPDIEKDSSQTHSEAIPLRVNKRNQDQDLDLDLDFGLGCQQEPSFHKTGRRGLKDIVPIEESWQKRLGESRERSLDRMNELHENGSRSLDRINGFHEKEPQSLNRMNELHEKGIHCIKTVKKEWGKTASKLSEQRDKAHNKKHSLRKSGDPLKKRKPLPAKIKHQVFLRDEGRCTAVDPNGQRCCSRRFLEIHHIKPLSEGGKDVLENLVLLCSGHHAMVHDK